MKKRLLKFALPIVLGVALMGLTLFSLAGCEPLDGCDTNELEGSNGNCMYCTGGNVPSYNWYPGCSNINNGVYCC